MATLTVTLRPRKRKTKPVYQLDHSIDGQRYRAMVGSNKQDAELDRQRYNRISSSGSTAFPYHLQNRCPLQT
jgi:hypothetical protein